MAELEILDVCESDTLSETSPLPSDRSQVGVHLRRKFLSQNESNSSENFPSVVPLSVGGYRYTTRLSTLTKYPDSMLAAMFSGRHRLDQDAHGNYFIDNNGTHFSHILEFLRNGTLPPNDLARTIYKEACYFNITPLVELLETTPQISKQLVLEAHREQFPDYTNVKRKLIRLAMDLAAVNRTGEVLVYAFRRDFLPKAPYFNSKHECVADSAHLVIGPWDSEADEDALIKCLELDLMTEGFHVKPHEPKRRCKYYNGQNCQKSLFKITMVF